MTRQMIGPWPCPTPHDEVDTCEQFGCVPVDSSAHFPITNAVDPAATQPSESPTRARLSVLVNRIEQWESVPALPPSATEDLLLDVKQCLESILASAPDKESR